MNKKRPVYLNLFKIKFPITAIASILHRISGVIVFLLVPLLLWMLGNSLASPTQFDYLQDVLTSIWVRFILWVFIVALLYHLFAGIRHLIMDMGHGESLPVARRSAGVVMGLTILFMILAGIWIW